MSDERAHFSLGNGPWFGVGKFRFPNFASVPTATSVPTENSELFRSPRASIACFLRSNLGACGSRLRLPAMRAHKRTHICALVFRRESWQLHLSWLHPRRLELTHHQQNAMNEGEVPTSGTASVTTVKTRRHREGYLVLCRSNAPRRAMPRRSRLRAQRLPSEKPTLSWRVDARGGGQLRLPLQRDGLHALANSTLVFDLVVGDSVPLGSYRKCWMGHDQREHPALGGRAVTRGHAEL
jgi:hypothetical protein